MADEAVPDGLYFAGERRRRCHEVGGFVDGHHERLVASDKGGEAQCLFPRGGRWCWREETGADGGGQLPMEPRQLSRWARLRRLEVQRQDAPIQAVEDVLNQEGLTHPPLAGEKDELR